MTSPSLRTRIFLTCGILVGIAVLIAIVGWSGQDRLLKNFRGYERTEEILLTALELDRDVQELKARSESFINTGAESQQQAAVIKLNKLEADIERALFVSRDEELTDLLEEMRARLVSFDEELAIAAVERNLRTSLVQMQLPTASQEVDRDFERMLTIAERMNDNSLATAIQRASNRFATGRASLLQYFVRPRYDEFSTGLDQVRQSRRILTGTVGTFEEPEVQNVVEQTLFHLDRYTRLALRAFQATRGYLYYSNVVMAGEVSEIVYYSDQLKAYVENRFEAFRTERDAEVVQSQRVSIAITVVALVLALVLAAMLSAQILHPVTALTQTFQRLASGETVSQVPGTDRTDELGRMAKAAEVFSRKNRETAELLDHSRRIARELEEQSEDLAERNRELDSFAYVASHDLKSPLRAIQSLCEWVIEDCEEVLPEESRRHLDQLQLRVARMEELLTDLLEYSRIGRIAAKIESVDLGRLLRSTVELLNNPTGIQIEIPTNLPTIETPRVPLQQVLRNLMTNALKYNDRAKEGRVRVEVIEEGDFLRFDVSDNGIGIDPRHHDRIFQMYQRIALDKAEGSGMGLAVVKKQVELYEGEITVESTLGAGSAFTFTWPRHLRTLKGNLTEEPLSTAESVSQ